MNQQTRQGRYIASVVRIATTINPRTEQELAEKWAKILAQNDSNQSQAIKNMIKNNPSK